MPETSSCSTGGAKRRMTKKVATKKVAPKKTATKRVTAKKTTAKKYNNQNGGFDTNFVAALSILAAKLVADSNSKKMSSPMISARPARSSSPRRRSNNNN
jgi:hypothetical protein